MIDYIRFRESISIGGEFGAIDSWSRDKHANIIQVEEKGNYLILRLCKAVDANGVRTYEPTGHRRRVPITSVAYISETEEPRK